MATYRTIDDFKRGFSNTWIQNAFELETIDFAQAFGTHLCDIDPVKNFQGRMALTTSQIRNVFGEVKRIQAKDDFANKEDSSNYASFLLLRPKLAYAEARVIKNGKSRISDFRAIIDKAHGAVRANNADDFQRFVDFMESILAYHKAAGGRES
jgi:CRISPR-associated protein Csm2